MQCKKCNSSQNVTKALLCRRCINIATWAKKERTILTKQCKECSKDFNIQRSNCVERIKIIKGKPYKYTGGNYCSQKCYFIVSKRLMQSGNHPTLGKTWKHTEEYKKKLSDARKGKLNPAYIHGEYSGKARRGVQQPQKIWRKEVYKRDKYTCQICKAKNGNGKTIQLNAHHICPWGEFKELRFDVANGTTLCVDCHRETHKNYREQKKKLPEGIKADVHFYIENYERLSKILKDLAD